MTGPVCMRCAICRRPLLRSAVPGLHIGPKCARDRLLFNGEKVRFARVSVVRCREPDSRQLDWVELFNSAAGAQGVGV